MLITIATREQLPFDFGLVKPEIPYRTEKATLPAGDYGTRRGPAEGVPWRECWRDPTLLAECAVIERKSLTDLYGSCGRGHKRFTRCLERMAGLGYAALVIEADLLAVMQPNEHLRHPTQMRPKAVLATLIASAQRHRIHCWACPSREFAARLTHRILERWYRDA